MMTRLASLALLAALALPSVAEAGALCGSKRTVGYAAPRFETSIRVARAPEAFRPVREERVTPRAPVKQAPVRIANPATEPSEGRAPDVSTPAPAITVAELSGSRAEGGR